MYQEVVLTTQPQAGSVGKYYQWSTEELLLSYILREVFIQSISIKLKHLLQPRQPAVSQ